MLPLLFCCFTAVIALFFPLRFGKESSNNKDLFGYWRSWAGSPEQRQGVRKA